MVSENKIGHGLRNGCSGTEENDCCLQMTVDQQSGDVTFTPEIGDPVTVSPGGSQENQTVSYDPQWASAMDVQQGVENAVDYDNGVAVTAGPYGEVWTFVIVDGEAVLVDTQPGPQIEIPSAADTNADLTLSDIEALAWVTANVTTPIVQGQVFYWEDDVEQVFFWSGSTLLADDVGTLVTVNQVAGPCSSVDTEINGTTIRTYPPASPQLQIKKVKLVAAGGGLYNIHVRDSSREGYPGGGLAITAVNISNGTDTVILNDAVTVGGTTIIPGLDSSDLPSSDLTDLEVLFDGVACGGASVSQVELVCPPE